ncbi:BTAD domain-containing putative transcriptional regulator [Gordonia sp. NPDC003424]
MTGSTPAEPSVEFRLFGRFVVLVNGAEVASADFGGRKGRRLLRILLTRHPAHISTDALTELLWPGAGPRDPSANIAVLVARARRAVGRRDLVVSGDNGYRMGLPDSEYRLDTAEFVDLVTAVRTSEANLALSAYRTALDLWCGEPLVEDQYDEWAAEYRDMLRRHRIEALERGAALCLQESDTAQAVEWSLTAFDDDPLRESAAVLAMKSLAAHGDPGRALVVYDRLRRGLADELGVRPSSAAVEEFERLLRSGAGSTTPEAGSSTPGASGNLTAGQTLSPLRFVGRDSELTRLRSLIQMPGAVATVAGHSGTGKSRLAAVLCDGTEAVRVRCFAAQRDDVWSTAGLLIRELLPLTPGVIDDLAAPLRGALATLVPDLVEDDHRAVDAETMRALIVELFTRLIAAAPIAVVVLDDIQWCDESSLSTVSVAVRRASGPALVLVYRSEEVYPGTTRHAALTALAPDLRLTLGGLDTAAVRGVIADTVAADILVENTDRSPMAITEAVRALSATGLLHADSEGRWRAPEVSADQLRRAAHATQEEHLGRRLDAVSGLAVEVIDLLAILRRETPAADLARVLATDAADVLDAVTRLAQADLVRLGEHGWAPAHDMISDVAACRLDVVRSARLHALAAAAIDASTDPASAAYHWSKAGNARRAAAAYAQAARSALDSYAHDEAESLATAGLQVGPTTTAVTASLHEVRALTRARNGDLPGARNDFRAALRCDLPGARQAAVLAELAMVASGSDDMVRAADLCEIALVRAGDEPAARARALEVGSILDMNLGLRDRATERAQEAMRLYTEHGNGAGVARVLDARAMASFLDGEITRGGDLLARAADLFAESGDLLRVVTPRSTHGHSLVFAGRPADGLVASTDAVELARTLGHQEGISYALWHRSEALSALRRSEEAVDAATEALAIAREIGHRGWTATAYRALGIAHQSAGDIEPARAAYRASLEASKHLDLFRSWACSRLAMVEITTGNLDVAAELVGRALRVGPGLGHHEARLANYLLAAARGDPDTERIAAELVEAAVRDGARAVVLAAGRDI